MSLYKKKRWQILFSAIVIGIITIAYYFYISHFYKDLERETQVLFEELSKKSAELIEEQLVWKKELLERAAESIEWQKLETYDEAFKQMELLKNSADFLDIGVVNLEGDIATYRRWEGNISDREYFQTVIRGDTVISEPLKSKVSGEVVMIYAAPIRIEDAIKGGIVAEFEADELIRDIPINSWSEDIDIVVVNEEYVPLFYSENSEAFKVVDDSYYVTSLLKDNIMKADAYYINAFSMPKVNQWQVICSVPKHFIQYKKGKKHWRLCTAILIGVIWGGIVLYTIKSSQKRRKINKHRCLESALAKEEIHIYYQPKMNIHTNQLIGAEALIRWEHPKEGMIYPSEFIPMAEQEGKITDITKYVMAQVCKDLQAWDKAGINIVPISINISRAEVYDKNILQYLMKQMDKCHIKAEWLEIEITENTALEDMDVAKEVIQTFKQIGIRVAMDDFGAGYSAPKYMKYLPFDVIKIDKCLVDGIDVDRRSRQLLRGMIDVINSLDMEIIAEGVENTLQVECLREMGIEGVQGYFYSKPICYENFTEEFLKFK